MFELMGRMELEDRIRAICLAFPGVTERQSHGSPAFFAGKQFLMLWPSGHHDHDFPHMWCAAPPGAQFELVTTEPDRFFRPPYVGGRGWVGARLDRDVDWDELRAVCEDAFRAVASKKLVAELDRERGMGLEEVAEGDVGIPRNRGLVQQFSSTSCGPQTKARHQLAKSQSAAQRKPSVGGSGLSNGVPGPALT
jgi:hypothetical protein